MSSRPSPPQAVSTKALALTKTTTAMTTACSFRCELLCICAIPVPLVDSTAFTRLSYRSDRQTPLFCPCAGHLWRQGPPAGRGSSGVHALEIIRYRNTRIAYVERRIPHLPVAIGTPDASDAFAARDHLQVVLHKSRQHSGLDRVERSGCADPARTTEGRVGAHVAIAVDAACVRGTVFWLWRKVIVPMTSPRITLTSAPSSPREATDWPLTSQVRRHVSQPLSRAISAS